MSLTPIDLGRCGISFRDFAYQDCHLALSSTQRRRNSRGILQRLASFRQEQNPGRTYLLSVSQLRMLHNTFPLDTIRTLLNQPHTIVFFLIPIKLLMHPHLFNYSRLPKARGSCLEILPFDPIDDKDDHQIVSCISKFCKLRPIDGFMSFDEDWPSRCRLAAVVRGVNQG